MHGVKITWTYLIQTKNIFAGTLPAVFDEEKLSKELSDEFSDVEMSFPAEDDDDEENSLKKKDDTGKGNVEVQSHFTSSDLGIQEVGLFSS